MATIEEEIAQNTLIMKIVVAVVAVVQQIFALMAMKTATGSSLLQEVQDM